MANYEATPVELYGQNNGGDQRRFTCADGTAIAKGAILKLTDPRTASLSTATGDIFAGIAAMAKEASDGSTSISCWENGIFEMTASGAISAGQKVKTAIDNHIIAANEVDISSYGIIVGIALETAADKEVINVRVLN